MSRPQEAQEQLYRDNLAALERRYPSLACALKALPGDGPYRRVGTAGGLVDLEVGSPAGPVRCYGVDDPLAACRRHWQNRELRNPAIMIFLGLDLGYQLFTHMERRNPNTQCYILVEQDLYLFRELLRVAAIRPLLENPSVHLVVGQNPDQAFLTLREILAQNVLYTAFKAASIESNSFSYQSNEDYYNTILRTFRDVVADLLMHAGNAPHDSFIGVRHMLLNLETIARNPGIKDIFGRFSGRAALIVATGPSLDKNFHRLREIQDRAVIISVDASLKFLLKNGIRPHFVTCLERVPQTVPFFEGLAGDACRDTVQLAVPVVVPEVYDVYPGPKAIVYRSFSHFAWLRNDKGTLTTGHSSANLAFKVAEALGCDPIILVGQDLAYAEDGSTHSSAAYWGKTWDPIRPERAGSFRVRGNVQPWVLTNRTWNAFRLCYVRDVADYAGSVINATEGGAYIEGTSVMPLAEAIRDHVGEPFPVGEQIREGLRVPSSQEATEYLTWVRERLVPETLRLLRRTAGRARSLVKKGEAMRQGRGLPHEFTQKSLSFLYEFFRPGMLQEVAGHVLQPLFIQTMVEHHHAPNLRNHEDEINRVRAEAHLRSLAVTERILRKLVSLYQDPEHTTTF